MDILQGANVYESDYPAAEFHPNSTLQFTNLGEWENLKRLPFWARIYQRPCQIVPDTGTRPIPEPVRSCSNNISINDSNPPPPYPGREQLTGGPADRGGVRSSGWIEINIIQSEYDGSFQLPEQGL